MIKIIKKRNGTKQPFEASKLNGWGEWASKSLGSAVDWQSIVLGAITNLGETVTSKQLQESLINQCIDKRTWEYSRMAGRLYAALLPKDIWNTSKHPSILEVHKSLFKAKMMAKLNYSDDEYEQIEKLINHRLDFKSTYFELQQIRTKYALKDKVNNIEYETPQFVYMRMAMALAENEPKEMRLTHVAKWYEHLSKKRINAPTPYQTNLGTSHSGFASCCGYTTYDTAQSLAAGDHIAYMMTVMSAGIGTHIKTRSLGDPIRGGSIEHKGKLPYYRAMVGAIGANLQNGRGGASTVHYTCYDSEALTIAKLKNPMSPQEKQVRGCDYSFGSNKHFARKVAKNENFAPFSYYDQPELYEAMYSGDDTKFEALYKSYIKTNPETVSARSLLIDVIQESFETGRHYLHFTDELNRHTPFKDKIYSSNLCQEIALSSTPFKSVEELYKPWEEGSGEIFLCNIAGIIIPNVESDEQYAEVAYYALKMIDVGIHKSTYVFKNLEDTAKSRLSAGVGILGLAHQMAKENFKFSTQEGRNKIHEIFETHAWHLYNASLKLGKELGNAPWMNKTKWPEGWLPLETYCKKVDELVTVENKRDWSKLKSQIIENGGIRNSVCIAMMPGESSSSSAGTTNGVYPIRDFDLYKTNDTARIPWVAPDSTRLRNKYEIAWDIKTLDLIKCYAIMQKWTDQGISADLYEKLVGAEKIGTSEMIDTYLNMIKYGMKTRYYQNTLTSKSIDLNNTEALNSYVDESSDCEACSL